MWSPLNGCGLCRRVVVSMQKVVVSAERFVGFWSLSMEMCFCRESNSPLNIPNFVTYIYINMVYWILRIVHRIVNLYFTTWEIIPLILYSIHSMNSV
jgi:hypothetical protein